MEKIITRLSSQKARILANYGAKFEGCNVSWQMHLNVFSRELFLATAATDHHGDVLHAFYFFMGRIPKKDFRVVEEWAFNQNILSAKDYAIAKLSIYPHAGTHGGL